MSAERGSWSSLTTLQKVALALGIPASGAILYILYRRYRESQDERLTFVGEEEMEIEVKVPKDAVRLLIGRHGATIKQLRRDTHARIEVDLEDSHEERLLRIYGSPVQVCKAKAAIHQIIAENLPVTEQIRVPQRAVGRIIGRGGETVRSICRNTGATVDCSRDEEGPLSLMRLITISGTHKQVKAAKQLITEKLSEDEAFQKKLAQSALGRSQRKHPLGTRKEEAAKQPERPPWLNGEASGRPPSPCRDGAGGKLPDYSPDEPQELRSGEGSPEESLSGASWPSSAFELPSPDFSFHANEYLEVFVSATENPNHFWIQIIGSRTLQLDKLTCEMTQYYGSGSCLSDLPSVHVGDIVAAPYPEDCSWYRATILGPLENGNLDLYYVDFGDNGAMPLEKLRPLRSDFLSLPFQAIQCSLAGIAPAGGHWEEAALDEFERLTHCARWKPIVAKISSYVPSGSSTWPHIQLYNTTTSGQNVNIGEELVRLGYAVWCPQDEVGAMGDGPCQAEKGAVSGTLPQTLGNTVGASLESLLSDPQKTPDELPLTLSCVSLSGEPIEQFRNKTAPPTPGSSPEGLAPSLDSLQLSSLGPSCPSENPSSLADQETGSTKGPSRQELCVEMPAQAEVLLESLPDARAFGMEASQTSSPAAHVRPGETPSPLLPLSRGSSGKDLSLSEADSSTYSPRGCFYYLSMSEDQWDFSDFCRGSPSLDASHQDGSPPPVLSGPASSVCSTSNSRETDELAGEEEAASVSESGDIFLFEDGSLTP
ncbi:tudor and KH domain-containing protein isoform X2 [Hemicordylus capensis]|nr:tudor and KH domain-containing protein isoform X2 [Hemicordylus capensis]XP_053134510.1 tudor and KH domain-containing protein isoform X2 [Hemicordylus capensis]XP_053134511.1 tudor and KH domain-containing protein isoform X2 [Hemicordylus capensis]